MTKQSRLAEEQNEIQKLQNQPVFDIGISQQQDSDDGTFYFYDKIVLVKIIYIDILREKHVVYFNRGKEIEESEYTHYIDANRQVFNTEFFSLNSIDYHHLKDVLDSRVYGKSCR